MSPSFHSLLWRSKVRGVDAIRKLATGAPEGVNRSSGSSTRLPITVMVVSPAMRSPQKVLLLCRLIRGAPGDAPIKQALTDSGKGVSTDAREGDQWASGRMTFVRRIDSFSVSWRSNSLTVAGSAVSEMTA